MAAELLNQYTESCKDAVKSSCTKLGKTFENLFLLTWILNWSATHQKLVWHLDIKFGRFCHIARIFSSLLLRSMESCCFRFPFVKV